jgi:phage-related protein
MLEVADKFATMPDGAQKSATAMALFGKSGADMIPLLNGGSEAVKGLSATMTTDFARGADSLNDKLVSVQTKLTELGVKLGTELMPALNGIADVIIGVANAFSAIPEPIQNLIILLVGLVIAWGPVTRAIVGVTSALALIGPAIPVVIAAFKALLGFVSATFVPAILALFSGPVGWTILAIAAVVAMAIAFRKPITDFLTWIGAEFMKLAKSFGTWLQPIGQALSNLWTGALAFAGDFFAGVGRLAQGMVRTVRAPFEALGNVIRSVFNGILGAIEYAVNGAVNGVNTLIQGYNAIPTAPDIPLIPNIAIPRFAEGGVVDRPTLAMVGEGGEREYIIPESKMAAASARYLAGSRGDRVVNAGPATINVTTGPVMQAQGQQWVTLGDLERAMRQTETTTLARIRTFYGRRAMGIA